MAAKVITVWNTYSGNAGQPPTYRVVYDGLHLPTVYTDRNKAKAMADIYNRTAVSNDHDIYGAAS